MMLEFDTGAVVGVEHLHLGHAAVRKGLQANVAGRHRAIHVHQQDANLARAAHRFCREFDFANGHGSGSSEELQGPEVVDVDHAFQTSSASTTSTEVIFFSSITRSAAAQVPCARA